MNSMVARLDSARGQISGAISTHRGKLVDVTAVAGSRILRQGVLVAALAVAARILTKELLGVWALIYIVVQFGVLLSDSGISTFVIREKELSRRVYSTAFYSCILLSLLVAAVTAAIMTPVSALLGYAGYEIYFMVASAAILPMGINAIQQATLRRDRRFSVILATDALANSILLGGIVTMLVMGAGLWSLVLPSVVASTVGCIACALILGFPAFSMDRESVKRIADYSLGLIGFSTVHYWARNADHLLIGRFLGAAPLGIYSVAYRIMMLPLSQINAIAHTVALPYMSPHQDDHARLRRTMRRLIVVIGALTTGPMILIWLQRYFVVELFLGPGWDHVADLLLILAPLAVFQTLVNPIGLCFQVSGKTRLFFVIGMMQTVALLTSFAIGVWMGSIDHVVIAFAAVVVLASPIGVHFGLATIGSGLRQWVAWCSPYFLCLAACWLADQAIGGASGTIGGVTSDALLAIGGGGAAAYFAIRAAWSK